MEKKREKAELEQRVAELERIVKELIEHKEDKRNIVVDSNWKAIGIDIHDYKFID